MANVLASPRFWRKKAVLLKIDAVYETDPVPTGAANWFEARNVALTQVDAELVDRNIDQEYFGHAGKVIANTWSKLSFDIALAGSGTAGTAPKWAPMVLACGFAETLVAVTSATYNLVSAAFPSCTAYLNIDGTLHKFIGCRGELKVKLDAGGIPVLSVDLTSKYTAPAASAMFTPITKTGWTTEKAVNSTNTGKVTINAVDLAFKTFEYATGNNIVKLSLPGPQREVVITDRKPTASITVLAPALGTFDPYALQQARTNVALSNIHETTAGAIVTTALKVIINDVKETEVERMLAYNLTMEPTPTSAGNDEITITCT